MDVEAVAPKESDPFFEKRDLAQLRTLMGAITKQRQEFKKLDSPLKAVLRVPHDSMTDDDMVIDHDSDDDDDDEDEDDDRMSLGHVDDATNTDLHITADAGADTDADSHTDTGHEKKKNQVPLSNGEGAEAPTAETVGTAVHDTTTLSMEGSAQSCNCSKVGQGIDKLAQGVSTLKLRCSHAHRNVSDAAIAAMNRALFPVLERGYQGPPPSPSSPSSTFSPRVKDKLVLSAATATATAATASNSASSVTQAHAPENNGVTVKGSLVVIKLPKTTRTVVMPKGHTFASILLPPTSLTTAEEDPFQVDEDGFEVEKERAEVEEEGVEVEEEVGAAGQKRSSASLKSDEDDSSLSAKKRR